MRPSTLKLMPEFLQTLFNQTRSLFTLKDPFQIQSRKVRFPPTSFFFFSYSYPSTVLDKKVENQITSERRMKTVERLQKYFLRKWSKKKSTTYEKEVERKICLCKLNNIDDNRRMLIDYRSGDGKIILSEKQ